MAAAQQQRRRSLGYGYGFGRGRGTAEPCVRASVAAAAAAAASAAAWQRAGANSQRFSMGLLNGRAWLTHTGTRRHTHKQTHTGRDRDRHTQAHKHTGRGSGRVRACHAGCVNAEAVSESFVFLPFAREHEQSFARRKLESCSCPDAELALL